MDRKLFYILIGVYSLSLIMGLGFFFKQSIKEKAKTPDADFSRSFFSKDAVAVVEIYGPIYINNRSSRFGLEKDADSIVETLGRLNRNANIKAVVLRINSPGGSVAAVQEICDEIKALRQNKKVVVASMGDVAASGGYYIASQCDKIVANPGTITGSIGVILQMANVKELFKKVGISMQAVTTGKYKSIGSPFRDLLPEEREIFQTISDEAYNQFVDAISQGRGMDRKKVKELADGRIYVGTQAKKLGLVDELGNGEKAIALAKQLAGLPEASKTIKDANPWSLLGDLFGSTGDIKTIASVIEQRKIRLDYMME